LCWQPKQTRTLEGGDELGPAQGEILYMNLALQRKKECTVYKIGLVQRENGNQLGPMRTEKLYVNLGSTQREIIHELGPIQEDYS
jgi:hypothetical protein